MPFAVRACVEDANIANRKECLSAATTVDNTRLYVCDILATCAKREAAFR
jgi:hypothetical protein